MKHIEVQEKYLALIQGGKKTVEGRLAKGRYLDIFSGDVLCFNKKYNVVVDSVKKYPSFREMISSEGISNVIPCADSVESATNVYYEFYTPEEELEFGVLAIKLFKKTPKD